MSRDEILCVAYLEGQLGRPLAREERDALWVVLCRWLAGVKELTVAVCAETTALASMIRSHQRVHRRLPSASDIAALERLAATQGHGWAPT